MINHCILSLLLDQCPASYRNPSQYHWEHRAHSGALDALRTQKESRIGALSEYFDRLSGGLEVFRIIKGEGDCDDKVVESIEQFLPNRNEAIEVFIALAQYDSGNEVTRVLHRFFERLLPYLDRPDHITSWSEHDFDNFRFIVHELFLYAMAALIKYEKFEAAAYLLRHDYYLDAANHRDIGLVPFSAFREYMSSLEFRNQRLKLQRLSVRADLLESRSKSSGFSFQQIMQADFTIYIRDCLECLRHSRTLGWWPETLLYIRRSGQPFEIYARAQSIQYFSEVRQLFDIETAKDLLPLMVAF